MTGLPRPIGALGRKYEGWSRRDPVFDSSKTESESTVRAVVPGFVTVRSTVLGLPLAESDQA
jgi:hypothetical protein